MASCCVDIVARQKIGVNYVMIEPSGTRLFLSFQRLQSLCHYAKDKNVEPSQLLPYSSCIIQHTALQAGVHWGGVYTTDYKDFVKVLLLFFSVMP